MRVAQASALLTALALAVGCSSAPAGKAQSGGTLTVAVSSFPVEDVVPWLVSGASMGYAGEMYDFVVGADSQNRITPDNGLATAWSSPDAGRTWVFKIRSGVKFHDGSALSASDVAFSLKQFASPQAKSSSAGIFQKGLVDAVADSPGQVTVTFKTAVVELPEILSKGSGLSEGAVVPKDYFERVGLAAFRQHPIGSGPWTFTTRQTGSYIQYHANAGYWHGRAAFDDLVIKLAPELSTRQAMLQSGEADIVEISALAASNLGKSAHVQTIPDVNGVGVQLYLAGKVRSSLWDPKVREALNIAIDRKAINDKIFAGRDKVMYEFPFGPGTAGFDPKLAAYPYNAARARQLLQEAGATNLTVNIWSFEVTGLVEAKDLAAAVANYWTAVGVKVNLQATEFGTFRQKYAANPQDFTNPGGDASPFISSRLSSALSTSQIYLISRTAGGILQLGAPDQPAIDQLYAKAAVEADPAKRQALLQKMQKEVYDGYLTVPLVSIGLQYGLGKRVGSWTPIPGGNAAPAYETVTHAS